jgi:hypothetical protein
MMTDTGCKFLVCGHENTFCDFVEWVDGDPKPLAIVNQMWWQAEATKDLIVRAHKVKNKDLNELKGGVQQGHSKDVFS